ncbi:MAG: YlxM family DNA-binding protein [Tissierella sp.]|uniref:YlxM family DNA-binding protein n=1 Tax=Tissierella sp. TaxID=41274 RepID=UPI003F9B727A
MVEKIVEVGILFDFYGKLLSPRQLSVIELFYIHDLSLVEIGEELNITRQAVYDTLKRSEKKLYEYEENLGLVYEFKKNSSAIESIIKISKRLSTDLKDKKNIEKENLLIEIERIENTGREILKNSREVGN